MTRVKKFFNNYQTIYRHAASARDPIGNGKPVSESIRFYLRPHDTSVDIYCHNTLLGTISSDNVMEFTAAPKEIWRVGNSLAMTIRKLMPLHFHNFERGEYKVITRKNTANTNKATNYSGQAGFREAAKTAQQYFQHLRINIETGEVVNPRDMKLSVNEEKRKIWLAGLKQVRLKLRTMARLGLLERNENRSYVYLNSDIIQHIAEQIMKGEVDDRLIDGITLATSTWTARRKNITFSEAVYRTFEVAVKSNSKTMRQHVGVLDNGDKSDQI